MLVRAADQAHSVRTEHSSVLPLRVRPDRCLPAHSLLPGHSPAQEARCAAVGNRVMSTPISEMITCAARLPISGIVVSSWICSAKGRPASSMRASSRAIMSARWSRESHLRAQPAPRPNDVSGRRTPQFQRPASAAPAASKSHLKSPTAREMTRATTISETDDCPSIAIFAHLDRGIVSVGLNEQAFVNDT